MTTRATRPQPAMTARGKGGSFAQIAMVGVNDGAQHATGKEPGFSLPASID